MTATQLADRIDARLADLRIPARVAGAIVRRLVREFLRQR